MQETRIWTLCQEDPLEKEMATHSKILVGEYPGQRSLAGYSPWVTRVWHNLVSKPPNQCYLDKWETVVWGKYSIKLNAIGITYLGEMEAW